MTQGNFSKFPWLLFERHVTELTGYGRNTIDKLVDCETLTAVKLPGCSQRRFRKIQVAALLGIPVEEELRAFRREPFLVPEKTYLRHTGYTRKILRDIVAAGGVKFVRPAGLTNNRYRKTELAELLGLAHLL